MAPKSVVFSVVYQHLDRRWSANFNRPVRVKELKGAILDVNCFANSAESRQCRANEHQDQV
jgi:hypothetical protein